MIYFESSMMNSHRQSKKGAGSAIKQFVLFVSLVSMAVVFVFLSAKNTLMNERALSDKDILESVGERVDLPEGRPSIRMVKDAHILQEIQPNVYGDVRDGDYILEYGEMIIIYRYSDARVIRLFHK